MFGLKRNFLTKILVVTVAVLFVAVAAIPTQAFAAEKMASANGVIAAVDNGAKTLTVKENKGEVTISADKMTKVLIGKTEKTFGDLKVGEKVKVIYYEKEGKSIASKISVKSAPAKAAEKHS